MIHEYMIFSALLAVPVSAMVCKADLLYFFILFPVIAVIGGRWKYCQRLLLFSFPPAFMLVWAYLSGNNQSVMTSLRWICALSAGTYFASELGTAGIAAVLRSEKNCYFAGRLSELITMAGSTASNVRRCWDENSSLHPFSRILQSAGDSVSKASSSIPARKPTGLLPFWVAIASWLFLLLSVSGIADGVLE